MKWDNFKLRIACWLLRRTRWMVIEKPAPELPPSHPNCRCIVTRAER